MIGTQRFVSNNYNGIFSALAAAGFVRGIAGAVLPKPIGRSGSSFIDITGTYTGAEEADYDFEIRDLTPTVPLITKPVFTGKGTGIISGIAFTAGVLTAQQFTIELNDLGQILRAASVDLFSNVIVARVPGAAANTLNLKVDRSALTHTPQAFALLADLAQDTDSIEGPAYDWDTKLLSGDGTIPAGAHRVSFGDNTNDIYLQYKTYQNGKTEYHFLPAIKQLVPKGTVVNFVTGDYSVELYDGVLLEETYTGIVTLYDFLNKIRTESTLLDVDSIVAFDRTPEGTASLEFPLNTDAYVQSNRGTGSVWATGFTQVSITPGAPTELVIATCFAANPQDDSAAGLGSELWRVEGSVSGVIADRVVSGDTVSTATYEFTIPKKVPTGFTETRRGEFQYIGTDYVERGDEENAAPPICPNSLTLGVNAVDQTITLVYTKRPKANPDCDCSDMPGATFDPICLGLPTIPTGGPMAYPSDVVDRLIPLYQWQADQVRLASGYIRTSNTRYVIESGVLNNDAIANGHSNAWQEPFVSTPSSGSSLSNSGGFPPAVVATLTKFQKESLLGMVANFEKTIKLIDKITDLTLRSDALDAWDDALTELQADVEQAMNYTALADELVPADEALIAGDGVVVYDNGTELRCRKSFPMVTGLRYGFVDANVISGADATVKYSGMVEIDTMVINDDCDPEAAPRLGGYVHFSDGCAGKFSQQQLGIDGNGIPLMILVSLSPLTMYAPATSVNLIGMQLLPDRYNTRLQQVLITGGLSPLGKANPNDGGGDGCWEDGGGTYYWLVTGSVGGGYAPASSNVPYVSSKYRSGQVVDGVLIPQSEGYFSTKEFAFVINVKCEADLKEGDTVTLSIGNAAYPATYQVGDELILEVVAAKNLELSGGNDGDNIQTWNVTGNAFGPLPSYAYDPGTPVAYDSGNGLEFLLEPGAIPFDKGDKFEFSVEGGHFRYRKNGGAWGADTAITDAPTVFDSGLSYTFTLGASPALFVGDTYSFKALQPYALSNVKKPSFERWEWGNEAAVVQQFDLGSILPVDVIVLGFHDLPASAVVKVRGHDTNPAVPNTQWEYTLPVKDDVMVLHLTTAQTARYIELEINGAANKGLGWFYVGEAISFTHSAEVTINRKYQVQRASNDFNPSARYKGKGTGSQVVYPEGALFEADLELLIGFLDHQKENDNEPFAFTPQFTRDEHYITRFDADNVDVSDVHAFQTNIGVERRLSATLPLEPVYFK